MKQAQKAFDRAKKYGKLKREWTRLFGSGRYDTMQAVVQAGWTTTSKTAIVATGESFPDALGASALAGVYDCPIVTVPKDAVSNWDKQCLGSALNELNRLGVEQVIVLGGELAVSNNVIAEIQTLPSVTSVSRVSATDRFLTSLAVYDAFKAAGGQTDTVIIASGAYSDDSFKTALSISPYSYANNVPILLANPAAKKPLVNAIVDDINADESITNVIIVSKGDLVPATIEEQLGDGFNYIELVGDGAYAMNDAVVEFELENGMEVIKPLVATGENFPDALTGGALAGRWNTPIFLVESDESPCVDELEANKEDIIHGYFLGGPVAVSDETCKGIATRTDMEFEVE